METEDGDLSEVSEKASVRVWGSEDPLGIGYKTKKQTMLTVTFSKLCFPRNTNTGGSAHRKYLINACYSTKQALVAKRGDKSCDGEAYLGIILLPKSPNNQQHKLYDSSNQVTQWALVPSDSQLWLCHGRPAVHSPAMALAHLQASLTLSTFRNIVFLI